MKPYPGEAGSAQLKVCVHACMARTALHCFVLDLDLCTHACMHGSYSSPFPCVKQVCRGTSGGGEGGGGLELHVHIRRPEVARQAQHRQPRVLAAAVLATAVAHTHGVAGRAEGDRCAARRLPPTRFQN